MLYKDQTIKITSCAEWMMTKLVVSVATIVGYNRCHTLRHRIKKALDVSLGYSSPFDFRVLPKLIWTSVAMHNATVQHPLITVSPNSNPTIMMLQELISKHNIVPFRCPCPPFIVPSAAQTPMVFSQG
ncbi:hypothetical protein TNCV_3351891 [Trichonephila clavipes]|nr:hypothetical protein TNCV_3351891 [Trichonephila clavipes]